MPTYRHLMPDADYKFVLGELRRWLPGTYTGSIALFRINPSVQNVQAALDDWLKAHNFAKGRFVGSTIKGMDVDSAVAYLELANTSSSEVFANELNILFGRPSNPQVVDGVTRSPADTPKVVKVPSPSSSPSGQQSTAPSGGPWTVGSVEVEPVLMFSGLALAAYLADRYLSKRRVVVVREREVF